VPQVFADTFYWIALLNPADKWHQSARTFSQANPEISVVTTDAVWTEVLNFSEAGPKMRKAAVALCDQTTAHARATVLPQTREVFARGFDLYKNRPDKRVVP
jgi:predicted nucleic acid-binding protein